MRPTSVAAVSTVAAGAGSACPTGAAGFTDSRGGGATSTGGGAFFGVAPSMTGAPRGAGAVASMSAPSPMTGTMTGVVDRDGVAGEIVLGNSIARVFTTNWAVPVGAAFAVASGA